MRVLVTGATGFIGKAVASELLRHGFEVTVLTRREFGAKFLEGNVKHFTCDITDLDRNTELKGVNTVESVVHCAGLAHQFQPASEIAFHQVNVLGTMNTVELAATLGAKQFVLTSSVSVYGKGGAELGSDEAITEDHETEPIGPYAQSKRASEVAAQELCQKYGIDLVVLRFVTVIGEGDRGNVSRLIQLIDRGRFLWVGKGANKKSMIYIDDAARACRLAVQKKGNRFDIFNVSAGTMSMRQIVDRIASVLGRRISRATIPPKLVEWLSRINDRTLRFKQITAISDTMPVWLREDVYSSEKMRNVYGFEPSVDLGEAIEREVRDFKARNPR